MDRSATRRGPIGLILPTFVQDTSPPWAPNHTGGDREPGGHGTADPVEWVTELCHQAEQMGADGLWVCDHLFWNGPCLEALAVLAIAATSTRRVTLGTCVLQLPLRQAPAVAKQAATLQILTQGRFVLGVGVGSHAGEYERAGIDYHTRGRQLDAGIAELRRAWDSGPTIGSDGDPPGGDDRYRQLPAPSTIPVWVGGSSEAALRRAAALADGWMPLFLSPVEYQEALERLAKEVDRVGRAAHRVTPAMVLFVSIDSDPSTARQRGTDWMSSLYGIPAKAFDRHLVSGTPAEVAAVVTAFHRAGAEHVAVYVTEDQPLEPFERLMAALPAAGMPTPG
jgi:alkanesulfonate monooxygenase SsuD/methylene tetrahydromethanopterin reductase-like flavin-dependent oxidoreductase (luciferase family)